jgi:hypothetical protein
MEIPGQATEGSTRGARNDNYAGFGTFDTMWYFKTWKLNKIWKK